MTAPDTSAYATDAPRAATGERKLIVIWQDPALLRTEALRQGGLEFLSAIRDGTLPPAPIQQLLNFSLEEVEAGRVAFASTPGEQHYNPIGVVHAGLAATLLDSAMGAAVHSTLRLGEGYTTLETKFNLVRPITAATGRIVCEGQVVHRGGRIATAEGRLTSSTDGKLLAHGTSTCLVIQLPIASGDNHTELCSPRFRGHGLS